MPSSLQIIEDILFFWVFVSNVFFQGAGCRRQEAGMGGGRRQEAGGGRQEAGGVFVNTCGPIGL